MLNLQRLVKEQNKTLLTLTCIYCGERSEHIFYQLQPRHRLTSLDCPHCEVFFWWNGEVLSDYGTHEDLTYAVELTTMGEKKNDSDN